MVPNIPREKSCLKISAAVGRNWVRPPARISGVLRVGIERFPFVAYICVFRLQILFGYYIGLAVLRTVYPAGAFVVKDMSKTFPSTIAIIITVGAVSAYVVGCGPRPRDYEYAGGWSKNGKGDGEVAQLLAIGVAPNGNVYLVDAGNNRVRYFTAGGSFLGQWGVKGERDGQFNEPTDIAINRDGTVFVVDWGNARIQLFSPEGFFKGKWEYAGYEQKEYFYPYGIGIGREGDVFISDDRNNRIHNFSPSGLYGGAWGIKGEGERQFRYPGGIAVGPNYSVYVADMFNHRIQYFSREGSFLGEWGEEGSRVGAFNYPWDVAFGIKNDLFVADRGNGRVQRFSLTGKSLGTLADDCRCEDRSGEPLSVAVNGEGVLYVVYSDGHVVYYSPVNKR